MCCKYISFALGLIANAKQRKRLVEYKLYFVLYFHSIILLSTCTENVKFQAETVVFLPGISSRQ